jgi:photosynthetic reaction center cytochrome c subunit
MGMNGTKKKAVFAGGDFALVVALAIGGTHAQSSAAPPAAARPKMAEEVYKNIQVLKGMPADEVIPTMQSFLWSLDVGCEFCHVMGKFELDVKETKQTARRMVQMALAINKNTFDGRREVTCYTCHRGSTKPVGMALDTTRESRSEPAGPSAGERTKPGVMPTVDQLLDKYVTAVGGADAMQKISSLVAKGTFADLRNGVQSPLEIFAENPAKGLAVVHGQVLGEARNALGDNIEGYNGGVGWITDEGAEVKAGQAGRPVRDMTSAEIDVIKLRDPFYFPRHVKQIFSQLRVERTEKVAEREAYVVSGRTQGLSLVRLYFDTESGLLVRVVHYTELPLDFNPYQIDYADYRNVDGWKIPFRVTINGQTFQGHRFAYQIDKVQQNIQIEDSKFAKPGASPASRSAQGAQ